MKIMLDVPNRKAPALLEVLRSISFVKATPLTDEKALLISEIKQSVEELKLIRAGKLKARRASDIIDEL